MEASYDPVPGSWYAAIGISMLCAAIYVVTFYPMQLPVWGLLLSLLVALIFLPACGIIAATTGTVIGTSSRLLPREKDAEIMLTLRPQRHNRVHCWLSTARTAYCEHSLQVLWLHGVCQDFTKLMYFLLTYFFRMAQALALVADLKLGLYCKIKPKAMFICQSYGTALGAVVNYSKPDEISVFD